MSRLHSICETTQPLALTLPDSFCLCCSTQVYNLCLWSTLLDIIEKENFDKLGLLSYQDNECLNFKMSHFWCSAESSSSSFSLAETDSWERARHPPPPPRYSPGPTPVKKSPPNPFMIVGVLPPSLLPPPQATSNLDYLPNSQNDRLKERSSENLYTASV